MTLSQGQAFSLRFIRPHGGREIEDLSALLAAKVIRIIRIHNWQQCIHVKQDHLMITRMLLSNVQGQFCRGHRSPTEDAGAAQQVLDFQILPKVREAPLRKQLLNPIPFPWWQIRGQHPMQDLIRDDRRCKRMLSKSVEAHGQLPERQTNMIRSFDPQGGVAEALLLVEDINQNLCQSLRNSPEPGM